MIGLSDWLATRNGTHAEFVCLPASAPAPAPAGITPVEAATLPANAQTAEQALDLLGLDGGQLLAVTGAAGAVGGFAIELARVRGIRTIGIAGQRDQDFIVGRGARFIARSADPGRALRAVAPTGVGWAPGRRLARSRRAGRRP